jgi:hypothetical protein
MSLTASTQGNVLPTPSFDTLFETSTVGTSRRTSTGTTARTPPGPRCRARRPAS